MQPIAVGVSQFNLTSPRLFCYFGTKLRCDRVDIIDPEVDKCVRCGIAGVSDR